MTREAHKKSLQKGGLGCKFRERVIHHYRKICKVIISIKVGEVKTSFFLIVSIAKSTKNLDIYHKRRKVYFRVFLRGADFSWRGKILKENRLFEDGKRAAA